MSVHSTTTIAALTTLGLVATGSSASLVGDTVALWATPQLNGTPYLDSFALVVDPGHEFEVGIANTTIYTIDLGPYSMRLDSLSSWYSPWFNSGFAPSSTEVRGMNFGPGQIITGVNVSFSSTIARHGSSPLDLPEFSADNVTFNADTVRISYGGYAFVEGSFIQIDLIVTPAPGAAGLLAGLGMLAGRRRRTA